MPTVVKPLVSGGSTEKPKLLYLCHRIPFPPDKGDKIRSYHLLRFLAERYRVYLGCFLDDVNDKRYLSDVWEVCADVHCEVLNPTVSRVRSLVGLVKGEPLTLPFYFSNTMLEWVNRTLHENDLTRCVVFSSAMAQYLYPRWKSESTIAETGYRSVNALENHLRVLIDFVDVDSDKWRQYAQTKPFPFRWLYRREADHLLRFEKIVASHASRSYLVSKREAALFKALAPEVSQKIHFYNNGVDSEYFDPNLNCRDPYRDASPVLLFTGAMDYWPNIDAVCWFAEEIFPHLRTKKNQLKFYIVGRNPSHAVSKLSRLPGVVVTGRVDDVRPYLKYATAVVAPLRIARGIQNKVLEAMAMEKVVMASDAALDGIQAELGAEVILTNALEDYQEFLPQILKGNCLSIEHAARKRVVEDFNWSNTLPTVVAELEAQWQWELEHD